MIYVIFVVFLVIVIMIAILFDFLFQKVSNGFFESEKKNRILERWLRNLQNGYKLADFFETNRLFNLSIYGYNELADLLFSELEKCSKISIRYVLDETVDDGVFWYESCKLLGDGDVDLLFESDAIIIADVMNGNDIREKLLCNYSGFVFLIEDLVRYVE